MYISLPVLLTTATSIASWDFFCVAVTYPHLTMIIIVGSGSHPWFLDSCVRSRRHHRRRLAGGNIVVCLRRICTSGLISAYCQFYLDGDGDGIGIIADRLSTPTYCRAQALQCSLTNRSGLCASRSFQNNFAAVLYISAHWSAVYFSTLVRPSPARHRGPLATRIMMSCGGQIITLVLTSCSRHLLHTLHLSHSAICDACIF